MATFQLELVSPEKLLLSRQVDMVIIPAAEGEMGVLPGHAPMIVALRGGAIRVTENGQITESLFVAGGFAEVTPDRVTVLADEATPLAEISRDPDELVAALTGRTHHYPDGARLLLGPMFAPIQDRHGPGLGFTHVENDRVVVASPELGSLVNRMRSCDACEPWTFGARALMRNLAARGFL